LQADEHVISKGLQDHPADRNALRDKPGNVSHFHFINILIEALIKQVAIVKMDEKVRDRVNVLNSLKFRSVQKQKRLEELQTSYNQMVKDSSDAVATDAGDSEDSQVLIKTNYIIGLD
jgi:hypothetical protein